VLPCAYSADMFDLCRARAVETEEPEAVLDQVTEEKEETDPVASIYSAFAGRDSPPRGGLHHRWS
jgi:hypothetical protein